MKVPNDQDLSDEEIYKILNYFIERGVREISFSGGEPLLRKNVFEFIKYLTKRNCKVTLLTNLTLLDHKKLGKLLKSGVYYIRTSIEGDSEKTHDAIRGRGNFQLLTKKLKMLRPFNSLKKGFSLTVTKDNWKSLDKIASIMNKYNLSELTISLLMPSGRGKALASRMLDNQEFRVFLDSLEQFKEKHTNINVHFESPIYASYYFSKGDRRYKSCNPCLIGRTFLGIKANGDIYACPIRDEVVIGNVRHDDMEKIWHQSEVLNQIRDLKQLTGKCSDCRIVQYCGGGCRAFSYIQNDDFCSPDPYCLKVHNRSE